MRTIAALAFAMALVEFAACGSGSDSAVTRGAADDNDAALGATQQVVNGCTIAPDTRCPEANFAGARLTGVDLSGASLGNIRQNPSPGNWEGANLSGANLSGATVLCVEGTANLVNVNFNGADLTGAKLGWAGATAVYLPDGTWVGGDGSRGDGCGIQGLAAQPPRPTTRPPRTLRLPARDTIPPRTAAARHAPAARLAHPRRNGLGRFAGPGSVDRHHPEPLGAPPRQSLHREALR